MPTIQIDQISLAQARTLAEADAAQCLGGLIQTSDNPLLSGSYLEGEFCWIFFRNKEISVPAQRSLSCDWAYAVSRRGTLRQIADLSDCPQSALDYLQKMSDFFRDQGL